MRSQKTRITRSRSLLIPISPPSERTGSTSCSHENTRGLQPVATASSLCCRNKIEARSSTVDGYGLRQRVGTHRHREVHAGCLLKRNVIAIQHHQTHRDGDAATRSLEQDLPDVDS